MRELRRDRYSFRLFNGKGDSSQSAYRLIPISQIEPNSDQPRTHFDEEKLTELSESIKQNGLLQPIVVRPYGQNYQIVVGERRYRACQMADMSEIPCIVQELDDQQTASAALVENIQREDLSPIEEAWAYANLIELQQLTQTQLAEKVGKSQSTIANKLRLIQLSEPVQEALKTRSITERHARALLGLDQEHQAQVLKDIIDKKLTVDQTDRRIKKLKTSQKPKATTRRFARHIQIAINTINQAVQMVSQTGTTVDTAIKETDEEVIMTIKMKK